MVPGPGDQEFRELIAKAEGLLRRVHDKATEIVNNVNRILGMVPGFVGNGIRSGTERLLGLLNNIHRELDKYLGKPGWPPALLSAGNEWADRVGAPVSATAGAADPDLSPILDEWKGAAADAYKRILGPQQKAILAIKKEFSDVIHSALTATAAAIVLWWGSIVVALVALVGGLIAAVGSTATVFGAPAGPVIGVAACLAFLAALATGHATLLGVTAVQDGNLRDKLAEWGAFGGESWPISTASKLQDGTLRDPGVPDDTDWRLRP
ncbi:hypothetical protein [Micromonospora sp. WMMD736]|uniref:hypothetical protein n=1 Tax=Micromonospora sp. WMMD736 TaxID=3404112 RepID=UPI003B94CD71